MNTTLAQQYDTFLREEGYQPQIDHDGDVIFKREGHTYFIQTYEQDPVYFRVVLPHFWPIESEEERLRVMKACVAATSRSKCAKIFPSRNNVSASIEFFLGTPDAYKSVFGRMMDALINGVNNFASTMRETQHQLN